MIQTFQFRTETTDKTYYHTVHSTDVKTAVDKWIQRIEDLQNEVYSFSPDQVQRIKHQYANGQLQVNVYREPYFLTYQTFDKHQIVNIDKVNKSEPDLIATITYLTAEEGGRKGYAISGYRPHVQFDGRKELTTCEQLFVDKEKVFPGETVTAEIRMAGKNIFKNYLFVGQHFTVAEGPNVVGHGVIEKLLH